MSPMIELRDVGMVLPSGPRLLTILDGITLEVPAGQFAAITGPSGSGKSTLLGLLAGLDRPTTGTVRVAGVDLGSLDEDALARFRLATIGYVFQSFHLIPTLTAAENVAVPLELAGTPAAARRARELLELVGLADRADHYPVQLSGGEQQRVALARAFANGPRLVLADEPTGNLDSATGDHIIELLVGAHRDRHVTLVLVTHDPVLAAHADRVVELRDGRVTANRTRVLVA
jgi:putative ABC transport system ATP-binding protein